MIKNLKKINANEEYPNIYEIEHIYKIIWILKISKDKFRINKLSAEEISDLLWKEFKINLESLSIKRILARAGRKIKTSNHDNGILYSLTNHGEKELMNLNKNVTISRNIRKKAFTDSTVRKLDQKFNEDIRELNICYVNECGTCAAFMLRKILEKAIFLKFAKNNILDELKDENGKFCGLNDMLKIATNKKIEGLPVLMNKTYEKLKSSKFLGDTAAHNFKVDVPIEMVKRELNYIEIALKELS